MVQGTYLHIQRKATYVKSPMQVFVTTLSSSPSRDHHKSKAMTDQELVQQEFLWTEFLNLFMFLVSSLRKRATHKEQNVRQQGKWKSYACSVTCQVIEFHGPLCCRESRMKYGVRENLGRFWPKSGESVRHGKGGRNEMKSWLQLVVTSE